MSPDPTNDGWSRLVFACGPRTVTVKDVIQAAYFRGDLERPGGSRIDAEGMVPGSGEPDEAAVQAFAEQFRYDRDLISTEETERWLEARGLTVDDFTDYCIRRCASDALDSGNQPHNIDDVSASNPLSDQQRVDLLLSGAFDSLAIRLSWRLALHAAGRGSPPDACDDRWLDDLPALEAAYRQECGRLLTADALERGLSLLRLPLLRVDVEMIDLESRAAAREAFLCVREDRAQLADVAEKAGCTYQRAEMLLEDLPEEWQTTILCAAPGDVLEPMEYGDVCRVFRLLGKLQPSLDDARIRDRVERYVVERHFAALSDTWIRWVMPSSAV